MNIKDMTIADLATMRIRVAEFQDTDLWAALKAYIGRDVKYISGVMSDPDTPMEKLKYAQGTLAQANRDIMLVERFLEALVKEQERRARKEERS